jgi:hypothetical protein
MKSTTAASTPRRDVGLTNSCTHTHSLLDHRNEQLTVIGKGNEPPVIDLARRVRTDLRAVSCHARQAMVVLAPQLASDNKTASGRFKTLVKCADIRAC